DVSNGGTSPSSPTLKWRKGCTADGSCTTGMSGLGQTWSAIRTITHGDYGSGAKPMLIFGGGYDTCEDYDDGTANHNCDASSKGHYVYVLDADTGEVLKTLDTGETRGVIADVALVVDRNTKHAVYGYTAD